MSDEVKFIDTSKETIQMLTKLSKTALRKSAIVINKIVRRELPIKTGTLRKGVTAWVKIDKITGQPYMDIGYRSKASMEKKYGIKYWVNPTWFEFGTKMHMIEAGKRKTLYGNGIKYGKMVLHPGMKGKNLLRNTVYNNIDEIRKAQAESLVQIEKIIINEGEKINLGKDEEID